jgi:hypothetical protein
MAWQGGRGVYAVVFWHLSSIKSDIAANFDFAFNYWFYKTILTALLMVNTINIFLAGVITS